MQKILFFFTRHLANAERCFECSEKPNDIIRKKQQCHLTKL